MLEMRVGIEVNNWTGFLARNSYLSLHYLRAPWFPNGRQKMNDALAVLHRRNACDMRGLILVPGCGP